MSIPFSFVGPESSIGGTFPSESQVVHGVVFGPTNNLTGNVVLPVVGDVLSGVQFGANGTEFTGTLASSGASAAAIAQAVWEYVISGFTTEGQAGTVLLAAAAGGTGTGGGGTSFATSDIQTAALEPKVAEADGVKMEARSIEEMIEADQYARKTEAGKKRLGGIRLTGTRSSGTTGGT